MERESLFADVPQTPAPDFVTPRGGHGPEQPEWNEVQTYSPEWYRRFRDWHQAEFPDADQVTRDNLDMLVRRAEGGRQ